MLIYWMGCILALSFAWVGMHAKHNPAREKAFTRYMIGISALPLILIAAFRYDVGQDYLYTYVPYFQRVREGRVLKALEPIYHYINVIVAKLTGEYFWVFAVCAVIFLLLVYSQIFEDSPYPLLSIFLLFGMSYYFIFLNAMRQMVGCAILLYSLRFVKEKQLIKFCVCVLLAAGFHRSCIVFLVVYFLATIKINPKVVIIVTIVLFSLSKVVGKFLNNIVMQTDYAGYVGSVYDTGQQGYIVLAINVALVVFAAFYYKNNFQYQMYFNLQIIAMWIAAFSGELVLINRLRWPFGLPSIILVPIVISNVPREKMRTIFSIGIVILYFIYITYTIGIKNGNNVLPYQTIFSR